MLVPESFKVPSHLSTEQFNFEVLGPDFSEIDYEAVMSSKERLSLVFPGNSTWPETDMSFETNKNDLVRHEKEFNAREAFAYAVFNSTKCNYLGCIYINSTDQVDYDCEVYLWVRDSKVALDETLFETVKDWLGKEWPFKRCAYPGRTITWEDWAKLTAVTTNKKE